MCHGQKINQGPSLGDKCPEEVSLSVLGRGSPCSLLSHHFLLDTNRASAPGHPTPPGAHDHLLATAPLLCAASSQMCTTATPRSLPPPRPETREVGKGKVSPALRRNARVCQKTKPVPFATHQLLLPQKRGEEGGRERGGHFVTRKEKP